MKVLLFALLATLVINHVSCGCGCPKQNLLKRSLDSLKLGDMLLDKSDVALINGFRLHNSNTKKWPNNEVLYAFDKSFPDYQKKLINKFLDELKRDLSKCLKIKESTERHFISLESYDNAGCDSLIGYRTGPSQKLNLKDDECMNKGTFKHAFFHALGFMHTHMRKDRDEYITFKWDQIDSTKCDQLKKCEACVIDGPYETTSIMHYGSETYPCVRGEKVIWKKNGEEIFRNYDTTPNDIRMVKKYYGCKIN